MMSEDLDALKNFHGPARLFPLPNVVLFPHIMQGLHIFEPRYRQMASEALAGDRLIAMVLMKQGWEEHDTVPPDLHSVACLGRIVAEQKLPDGRYNLQLRGMARVGIEREVENAKLYRSAEVKVLEEIAIENSSIEQSLRSTLGAIVPAWWPNKGNAAAMLTKLLDSDISVGTLGDVISYALPLPIDFKQELLATLDVQARLRRLIAHLTDHQPSPQTKIDRTFPPDFSVN